MSVLDDILHRINPELKYEDLTEDERNSLLGMVESLQQGNLTVAIISTYIIKMREGVSQELTKPDLNPNQDLFLKARLRNYILLEILLTSPERAKAAVDKAIEGMAKAKKAQ